ncbi:SDR family NAD(P)-dependent oxidoreductase [Altererythrobacter xixiisoli]|uniref:SDR family NAD(P)-dependent oxidoreductase n=1 Tax=Croceibacterium xixiisoli TaxID=1476466 RepID=A0A6I4TXH5_9SPHN|nr:SDR family oxidoreductase [Croceibacterium xixiisoli]MXO99930.1 SDR family NAD(P)-dependent oxidoreductase [Croceibacterium xixiisoli]
MSDHSGSNHAENLQDAHTEQPSLAGRRVVVTGGTTGIGRAIAVLLASEGARVFICGRTPEHLDDALARIREVGEGDGINVDLANREDVARFFAAADDWLGGLDIAVINAAVPAEALADTPEDDLDYQIAVDFTSYLTTTRAALDRMGAGSDVVLIGSMSAVSRSGGSSVYVAAKAGIQGFAHALREELGDDDIKIGLIEPGFTGADFQYPDYPPEKQRELIGKAQMLRAEDIAAATHFMLTQPRRTAVSLMRVETRRDHP